MTNIQRICVCGGGTMGKGIAQVIARAGIPTILFELNESVLQKAKEEMDLQLQALVDKGKLNSAEKEKTLQRIQFTSQVQDCRADLFIEAIVENPEAKLSLFHQLSEINGADAIFATNTSSLSVSRLSVGIRHSGRLIGLHFFNPAPVMRLVEVVVTDFTNADVIEIVLALCRQIGKTPVVCRDWPGFIVNRVARPYYIESLRIAEEGQSTFEQIDRVMESIGFRMGPFRLMDLIGNDINYAVSNSVYTQLGQPERLKPSFLQQERVDNGQLGRKTGKGYYDYP